MGLRLWLGFNAALWVFVGDFESESKSISESSKYTVCCLELEIWLWNSNFWGGGSLGLPRVLMRGFSARRLA